MHIPQVICMDCRKDMTLIEGTKKRICGWCDLEVEVEVIEQ